MTPTQIRALLGRIQDGADRLVSELTSQDEIDATGADLGDMEGHARRLAERLRELGRRVRESAETLSEMADSADGVADDLDGAADSLHDFLGNGE